MPTAGRSPNFAQLESNILFKVIRASVVIPPSPHEKNVQPIHDPGTSTRNHSTDLYMAKSHAPDCTQKGIFGQLKGNIH